MSELWTVCELRRRWKPTKERLAQSDEHEPIRIRIHRCCSWLQRVEDIVDQESLDSILIQQWIALNCLYGCWDHESSDPIPERTSLRVFIDRVLELDADRRLAGVLEEHRKLVMSIFDDEYLTKYFWEDPGVERAKKSRKIKFDARTWYIEERYGLILERVLERTYLLRCQLVHGAATFGSKLNRTALRRCSTMLGHLLPAFLLVLSNYLRTPNRLSRRYQSRMHAIMIRPR